MAIGDYFGPCTTNFKTMSQIHFWLFMARLVYGFLTYSMLGIMLLIAPTTMLLFSYAQNDTTNNTTKQSDKQLNLSNNTAEGTTGTSGASVAAQKIFQSKTLTLGKNVKNKIYQMDSESDRNLPRYRISSPSYYD